MRLLTMVAVVLFAGQAHALTKKAAIRYVKAQSYGRAAEITVTPNTCTCAVVSCDSPNDLRVNCSGAFLPLPGVQGYLTALGAVPGENTSCGTCGCNLDTSDAALSAAIICI